MEATAGAWRDLWRGGLAPQFALLILGVWLNAADTLVSVTVMPSVARQLGGYAYFGWATAGFLVGAITAGASAGEAAHRLGLRSAMATSGAIYAVGCALGAGAPGISIFLLARCVQGIGGGWIIGLAFVAVGAVFPERLWARVFAAITAVWGVATLLGPLVGGAFAAAGPSGWRGAFWVFAAQGGLFAAAAALLLPAAKAGDSARPLPWRQLALLTLGVLLIGSAGPIGRPGPAAGLIGAGLLVLSFMLWVDAKTAWPLLPKSTHRLGSEAGRGYATIFLLQAGAISWSVYGSAFLQALHGASPLTAGYVVSGEALGWTLAALPVSGLGPRWHSLFITLGAGCVAAGVGGLACVIGPGPLWPIVAFALLLGSGFGLAWSFLNRAILASLPEAERSAGSSAIPTVQMIGNAAGAAGVTTLADFLGLASGVGSGPALKAAPLILGAFFPVALLGAVAAARFSALTRQDGAEKSLLRSKSGL